MLSLLSGDFHFSEYEIQEGGTRKKLGLMRAFLVGNQSTKT